MRFFRPTLLISLLAWSHALTKEEVIKRRNSKRKEVDQHLQILEEQMERHRSGERVLPDDRLSSLKMRIDVYLEQLLDNQRILSDQEIDEIIAKAAHGEL